MIIFKNKKCVYRKVLIKIIINNNNKEKVFCRKIQLKSYIVKKLFLLQFA